MDAQLLQAIGPAIARLAALLPTVTRPNSAKFAGLTFDQLMSQVLSGTVANAVAIGGKTIEDLKAAVDQSNADVEAFQAAFAEYVARRDNPHEVTLEQILLDNLHNWGLATQADFDANAADKYVNPALVQAAIDAAIAQIVGDAPEAMDTLQEIAAILKDDPQVINDLLAQVGGLINAADLQAVYDKLEEDIKAYADQTFGQVLTTAEQHSDTNVQSLVDILNGLAGGLEPVVGVNPRGPLFGVAMTSGENSDFKVTDTYNYIGAYGWYAFDNHESPAPEAGVRSFWYPSNNGATSYLDVECKKPRILRHMRLLHDLRAYQAQSGETQTNIDLYRPGYIEVLARDSASDSWTTLRGIDKNLYWEANGDTTYHADMIFVNEKAWKYYRFRILPLAGRTYSLITNLQLSEYRPVGEGILLAGDGNLGYFGEVSGADLITPTALATAIGLAAGTAINPDSGWLKFAYKGKVLHIAKTTQRYGLVYSQLQARGAVAGTGPSASIPVKGSNYKVRALDGVNGAATQLQSGVTYTDLPATRNTEFSDLLYRVCAAAGNVGEDNWAAFSLADLGFSDNYGIGSAVICQESTGDQTTIFRGFAGIKASHHGSFSGGPNARGFRPVLEPLA